MRNTWENRGYWGLKEEERTNNRRAIYLKSMKEWLTKNFQERSTNNLTNWK